jgi:hypothetical protein
MGHERAAELPLMQIIRIYLLLANDLQVGKTRDVKESYRSVALQKRAAK